LAGGKGQLWGETAPISSGDSPNDWPTTEGEMAGRGRTLPLETFRLRAAIEVLPHK
jgi:hypothetical protein